MPILNRTQDHRLALLGELNADMYCRSQLTYVDGWVAGTPREDEPDLEWHHYKAMIAAHGADFATIAPLMAAHPYIPAAQV